MFRCTTAVTKEDLEPGYDHLNHADALRFLELGRLRFLEHIGFPNEVLLSRGLFLVITKIAVTYRREVMAGEIEITVENPLLEGKFIVLEQQLVFGGKVAVKARVESVFMSQESRRAIPVPSEFAAAFVG